MFEFEFGMTEQAIILAVFLLAVGYKKFPLIMNGLKRLQNSIKPKT